MPGLLNGRVALITGGGGEIGGAIARRFAAEGAAVAVADIRRERAEAVAKEIADIGGRSISVRTNVAVEADAERSVRHAVEAFGSLTTLVNVMSPRP
jgi:NAD(P)-dependent dehydrogenase (short-subunit alcohol dehydrogenase family)